MDLFDSLIVIYQASVVIVLTITRLMSLYIKNNNVKRNYIMSSAVISILPIANTATALKLLVILTVDLFSKKDRVKEVVDDMLSEMTKNEVEQDRE